MSEWRPVLSCIRLEGDEMIRRHFYFSGEVQGVGFRFRCQQIADKHRLTGWCKNLYDGRVEVELQGQPEEINMFVVEISKQPWIDITNIEEKDEPVNRSEKKFTVRYY